jgi:DNA-binding transcriptional ArsR family regulator
MEGSPGARELLALLAEPDRLKALAAVALGAENLAEVAERAGLEPRAAARALSRLVAGGLLEGEAGKGYRVRTEALRAAARPAGTPQGRAGTTGPDAGSPGGGAYPSGELRGVGPSTAPGPSIAPGPSTAPGPSMAPGPSTAPGPGAEVLRRFVHNGRLLAMPAAHGKRLVVLDYLAGLFEPGRRYPEPEVNELLGRFHPDYAMLRRYLVDDGFLDRADEPDPSGSRTVKVYWRSGGTVDLD